MTIQGQDEKWFYELNGQRYDNVSFEQLVELIQTGALKKDNLVWKAGFSEWVKIEETDLAKYIVQPPPIQKDLEKQTTIPEIDSNTGTKQTKEKPEKTSIKNKFDRVKEKAKKLVKVRGVEDFSSLKNCLMSLFILLLAPSVSLLITILIGFLYYYFTQDYSLSSVVYEATVSPWETLGLFIIFILLSSLFWLWDLLKFKQTPNYPGWKYWWLLTPVYIYDRVIKNKRFTVSLVAMSIGLFLSIFLLINVSSNLVVKKLAEREFNWLLANKNFPASDIMDYIAESYIQRYLKVEEAKNGNVDILFQDIKALKMQRDIFWVSNEDDNRRWYFRRTKEEYICEIEKPITRECLYNPENIYTDKYDQTLITLMEENSPYPSTKAVERYAQSYVDAEQLEHSTVYRLGTNPVTVTKLADSVYKVIDPMRCDVQECYPYYFYAISKTEICEDYSLNDKDALLSRSNTYCPDGTINVNDLVVINENDLFNKLNEDEYIIPPKDVSDYLNANLDYHGYLITASICDAIGCSVSKYAILDENHICALENHPKYDDLMSWENPISKDQCITPPENIYAN